MKILKSAKKIDLKIDNRIDTEICYRYYKLMYEQLQLLQTNKNCRQISNQHASEGFQVTCKFIDLSMRNSLLVNIDFSRTALTLFSPTPTAGDNFSDSKHVLTFSTRQNDSIYMWRL